MEKTQGAPKCYVSAQMLEVSLLGVGVVLRLERDAWSMVKGLKREQQMSTPHYRALRPNTSLNLREAFFLAIDWAL